MLKAELAAAQQKVDESKVSLEAATAASSESAKRAEAMHAVMQRREERTDADWKKVTDRIRNLEERVIVSERRSREMEDKNKQIASELQSILSAAEQELSSARADVEAQESIATASREEVTRLTAELAAECALRQKVEAIQEKMEHQLQEAQEEANVARADALDAERRASMESQRVAKDIDEAMHARDVAVQDANDARKTLEEERRARTHWAKARLKLLDEFCAEENKLQSQLEQAAFSFSSSPSIQPLVTPGINFGRSPTHSEPPNVATPGFNVTRSRRGSINVHIPAALGVESTSPSN